MLFIQLQYSITMYYCFYTISFIRFSAYINHISIIYSTLVSLSPLNTLLTETNSSWLTYKSIKSLEIRTLKVPNLDFPSNTILSCFFFFFLIIDFYFYFFAATTPLFVVAAEIAIQEPRLMKQMQKQKHKQ